MTKKVQENYVEPAGNDVPAIQNAPLKDRVAGIESLTRAVLWVGIISVGSVVLGGFGLILDQLRANNAMYREQDRDRIEIQTLQSQQRALQNEVTELKQRP